MIFLKSIHESSPATLCDHVIISANEVQLPCLEHKPCNCLEYLCNTEGLVAPSFSLGNSELRFCVRNSANWDNTNVLLSFSEFQIHNNTFPSTTLHNVFKWERNQDNTGTKATKQDMGAICFTSVHFAPHRLPSYQESY